MPSRPRIITGDRPTGRLHLGHYVGSLANRVRLQDRGELFLLVADLHQLTTRPEPAMIAGTPGRARDLVLDTIAAGVDPAHAVFYLQSGIPEVWELEGLFLNLVSVSRLERVPSLKQMAADAGRTEMPAGLLAYPVLQAADILGVRGEVVPVGHDNVAHVEVAREIARRANHLYGTDFPVPRALPGAAETLVGTDGAAKMSKTRDNAIYLADDAATVRKKVMGMYTDPARVRADVPGRVEGNPVFAFHAAFNPDRAEVEDLAARYRAGRVGDVEVKEKLVRALERFLAPLRERRAAYADRAGFVEELILRGTERARDEVRRTIVALRRAMGLAGVWTAIARAAARPQ